MEWILCHRLGSFIIYFLFCPFAARDLCLAISFSFVFSIRFAPAVNISIAKCFRWVTSLRFSKLIILVMPFILFSFLLSVIFAAFKGGGLAALLYRISNGFDQIQLLNSSTINLVADGLEPVYPLVWLKSFLRPLFPELYNIDFDNYTEHMQHILYNIRTDTARFSLALIILVC